ncbi:MAG: FG-GAP repeat protein, partial [Spirochaetales bacterium]|nr:FG-GAP repeat protein [Spirochaetales bacterium]
VGAAFEDGTGSDRGAAYFFYHSAIDTWDFGGKITASDAQDNDSFGLCSSISGEYVIIGTDYEDGIGSDRGAAYIFK